MAPRRALLAILVLLQLGSSASFSQRKNSNAVVPCAAQPVANRQLTRTPYKVQRSKPVTTWLLYANAATFVVLYRQGGLFRALAKDDRMLRRGGSFQSYRMLSACFLHANLPHLLVNSNSLNALG